MGTVVEKLNKVIQTKEDIAAAIAEKGVKITDKEAFSTYSEKIREIQIPMIVVYGGTTE